jgi:hypothetical protein
MARAGPVPGIRPKKSLRSNASKVIAVRLAEMLGWQTALEDQTQVAELHNMRIAAKRLRYALEMFEICFDVKALLKELTQIQEDLGDIHDLDVLCDVLRGRLKELDAPLEQQATEIMAADAPASEKSRALRRLLSAQAHERRRLGLLGLLGNKIAERQRRYHGFVARWGNGKLDEFAARVRAETQPRADEPDEPVPIDRQPTNAGSVLSQTL